MENDSQDILTPQQLEWRRMKLAVLKADERELLFSQNARENEKRHVGQLEKVEKGARR